MTHAQPSSAEDTQPSSPRSGYVLALVALIGSLLLVGLYARNAEEREQRAIQAELESEAAGIPICCVSA